MNAPHVSPLGTSEALLSRRDAGAVAILTLTSPSNRNALSLPMIDALAAQFDSLQHDKTIRAVVLSALGAAFCAGHDLKELTAARTAPDKGLAVFAETMRRCAALMQAIVALPQPVIAAVEATATAAGCQLVATCDLAVAGAEARFCTPGVDIGLFCSTPMVALSRNVGRKHAMEMLLTGEMIAAQRAADIGLVNRVVAAGTAEAAAEAWAQAIARKSAATVRTGKRAFYAQAEMGLAQAYDYAARVMTENLMARDAAEGISAFIEKRAPRWES